MVRGVFCLNTRCKHYFEDTCIHILTKDVITVGEYGKCETFEEGVSEYYLEWNGAKYLPQVGKAYQNCSDNVDILLDSGEVVVGYYHHNLDCWFNYNKSEHSNIPSEKVKGWRTIS